MSLRGSAARSSSLCLLLSRVPRQQLPRSYVTVPSPVFAFRSPSNRSAIKRVLAAAGLLGVGVAGGYRFYNSQGTGGLFGGDGDHKKKTGTKPVTPAVPPKDFAPRPIVLCGPSGSGKSTLLKRLFAEYPENFGFSVSHTTRSPRPGETDGKDYHFVSRDKMLAEISANHFLEHAEFASNMYGTSFQSVDDVLAANKHVILDIDMQGVLQLQTALKSGHVKMKGRPLFLFIAPPNVEVLEKRLTGRGTEDAASLKKRLDAAKKELEWGLGKGNVDAVVVNDDVEKAYGELKAAIFHDS
ncbi:guanylate kinase [Thoreauomyces humboldtii]|nr:guanylate kinase [Thoreauomyces humboldtii]